MGQTTNRQYYQNRPKQAESDTTYYTNLTVTNNAPAITKQWALQRREVTRAVIARFSTKYTVVPGGCWLWTAGTFKRGYGMCNLGRNLAGKQHTEYAHRVSYVISVGDIPAGAVVMHACDTPACVNPAHLALGTQRDNIADARRKGRARYPGPTAKKLTTAEVIAIRESVESRTTLAQRFGVTAGYINLIRRGQRRRAA